MTQGDMTREEQINKIIEIFELAISDKRIAFADRQKFAFEMADGEALGAVWRRYGIMQPLTQEMRAEAEDLRKEAIGF